MNENYKLIGVIKTFGIYPDFTYPVFERNGKYYYQMGRKGVIVDFKEISENNISRIALIVNIVFNDNANIKSSYVVGDEIVVCFQISRNCFIINDVDGFVPFIKEFPVEDEILKEEIELFLDGVKLKNNSDRIKKKKLVNT